MGLFKKNKPESIDQSKGNKSDKLDKTVAVEGLSHLHNSIVDGNLKLTMILIQGGADVNGARNDDQMGLTALMTACVAWNESFYNRQNIMDIMQVLFDQGADPYKCNFNGQNAYDFAKQIGCDFLNVQMCIWYNQRKTSGTNGINITGNIINQRPTPSKSRRKSLTQDIINILTPKRTALSAEILSIPQNSSHSSRRSSLFTDISSMPKRSSDDNIDYLLNNKNDLVKTLTKHNASLPATNVTAVRRRHSIM